MKIKNFFKKLLTGAAVSLTIFSSSQTSAHEIFWYDREVGFDKFAKIVIFPLTNAWDAPDAYQLGREGTRNFRFNSHIDDRLQNKLKKVFFVRLANEIHEKEDILQNNLGHLLNNFPNEKARAAAVEEATVADAYLVPRFRENRVQEDISPRRDWNVQLKSWTEITGGPRGREILNERTRVVHHTIPEKKIYLHIMDIEFTGYDKDAKKILTSLQMDRRYGISEEGQFKRLVNDFQKVLGDAKKGKNIGNEKAGGVRIGFSPVTINGMDDVFATNALDYALQDEATKRIKKAKVIVNTKSTLPMNYYIRSHVTRCDLVPVWHDPSYSLSNVLRRSEKRKWWDQNGNEHEMWIRDYDQEIVDHYAYWSFYWAMNSDFWLVTPQNSVVYSASYRETDDKPVDAYRHSASDFCKKVNARFK